MSRPVDRLRAKQKAQQLAKDARALRDFAKGRNLPPEGSVEYEELVRAIRSETRTERERTSELRAENRQQRKALIDLAHRNEKLLSDFKSIRARTTDAAVQARCTARIHSIGRALIQIDESLAK